MKLHINDTPAAVARAFADWLAELSSRTEKLTIALSGGSTPAILFRLLAEEYNNQIDWTKLHFFWGDERCVPPDDEESNYKMTRELLFDKVAIPADNIYRIRGEEPPEEEAERYANIIAGAVAQKNGLPAFDLIMLGMGGDGHTASIFPDQMELLESQRWCEVATHPESGQQRVTLTGPVINNAQSVAFLVTGSSKTEKVDLILSEKEERLQYPAAHIHPYDGQLHWFMDKAAAAGIGY
jgi:6-phosphogluconolactonase